MSGIRRAAHRLWTEEAGQGLVEYGLVAVGLVLVVVGTVYLMGGDLRSAYSRVTQCFNSLTSGAGISGC